MLTIERWFSRDREEAEVSTEDIESATVAGLDMDTKQFPTPPAVEKHMKWRMFILLAFAAVVMIAFHQALVDLPRLAMKDETYSHMPLIPVVSGYLLFLGRQRVFAVVRSSFFAGSIVVGIGILLWCIEIVYTGGVLYKDWLSLQALSALTILLGGFIGIFGLAAFRQAAFPLLFLFFLVPIPSFLLHEIVLFLQRASTEVAHSLFLLAGVPILRNGYTFELPGMSVVVAEQCCGIRSSLSLMITGVLAAYLGLKNPWRRGALILSVFPITIFKNALRIVTLSLLGAYVDQRILGSVAHRMGGIPFFALALLLFGCVLWFLRRSDARE